MTVLGGCCSEEVVKAIYRDASDDWLRTEFGLYENLYEIEQFENTVVFDYMDDCRRLLVEEMAERFMKSPPSNVVYLKLND